ncbi:hypothetical protein [Pseudomonas viridiflava]|uniref:hypothetical protein n=1 Tax=Pseudomonas viridiflava TaxID=33069 RepID=UPI0010FAC013|nr:hypothetical protein [Pseudomonas viridiflava]
MKKPEAASEKRLTMLSVKSEDFVRFLISKGAEKDEDCPVCHMESWTILCPDDDGPTLRIGLPVRNRPKTFYLSTFAYFCDNCGYIRMHMAATVHEWVSENPAPSDDQAELDMDMTGSGADDD